MANCNSRGRRTGRRNVNLLRLNASRVKIMHAAIASEICPLEIANPDAPAWAYRTERNREGAIDGITVSKILDDLQTYEPFICKVDIEGAETELFSNNTSWVARFPIVIMETHDWLFCGQATARNFLRIIADLDRDFYIVGENIWSISNSIAGADPTPTNKLLPSYVRT